MLAVIRLRGRVDVNVDNRKTLELLGLRRKYQLALVRDEQRPMVEKVAAYVTYGEVDKEILKKVLLARARSKDGKKLNEEVIKELGFNSIDELVDSVMEKGLKRSGLRVSISLHPPRGGLERGGIKRFYKEGGALGYRGKAINELIEKML